MTRRQLIFSTLAAPFLALLPKMARAKILPAPATSLTVDQIMAVAAPAVLNQPEYRSLGYTTKGPYQLDNSTAFIMEMRHSSPHGFYWVPMVWTEKDNTAGSEKDKVDFCHALLINGIESLKDYMQQYPGAITYLTNAWNRETKGQRGLHDFTLFVSPALYRAYESELKVNQRILTHYDGPAAPPTLVFKLGRVVADPQLTDWNYRFIFHPRYHEVREPLVAPYARPALAQLPPTRIAAE